MLAIQIRVLIARNICPGKSFCWIWDSFPRRVFNWSKGSQPLPGLEMPRLFSALAFREGDDHGAVVDAAWVTVRLFSWCR